MTNQYQYTALICSLPACDKLFASRQTPISRFQLQRRLKLLDNEDARDIAILGEILDWFRHPLPRTDHELISLIHCLAPEIQSASLRQYIEWRLEFRTLVAALRQKHRGIRLADENVWSSAWLGNRWVKHIIKHWQEPGFGLEKQLPWLPELTELLESEQAVELEKFILALVWDWLEKKSFGHEFDLEAVAIYRMRWDLVSRWTSYHKSPANDKFCQLLDMALDSSQR